MKVEFHSGVSDKLGAACRFLRSAQCAGASVVVCGDDATLERLDIALWTFDPLSFVAHVRVRGNDAATTNLRPQAPAQAPAQAWLADSSRRVSSREVLLNLGPEMADGWEEFARVVEMVSAEPADADAGRARWRQYTSRPGLELIHRPRATGA